MKTAGNQMGIAPIARPKAADLLGDFRNAIRLETTIINAMIHVIFIKNMNFITLKIKKSAVFIAALINEILPKRF